MYRVIYSLLFCKVNSCCVYNRNILSFIVMSGLEEVGVPGPDHLREALTNCTDPLAAIEEFQARTTVRSCNNFDVHCLCFGDKTPQHKTPVVKSS